MAWCCMAAGPAAGVGVHGRRHPDLSGDTGLGPSVADSADAWAAPVRPIRPRGEQEAEAGRLQWTCTVPSLTHPQAALPAPRTRHLPTPASPRASPLLTWAQQQVNVAPPLPAPPGFTRGHSFPPETPTKGLQGRQVTREGDTGRRGTDGAISFSTFSCSFSNDHVVFLNQRMNKRRRVKGGLDRPSLKQVSDEPDDTELWVPQPGVPSLCPWHTCVSRTHRPVSLSRRAPTGAAGGRRPAQPTSHVSR